MKAKSGTTAVDLRPDEQWFAPGQTVVELTYYGGGHYGAIASTVLRVTACQIVVTDERRFWRDRCGRKLVGQTDRLNGGIDINPIRLVPPNNPHAMRLLGTAPTSCDCCEK